MLWNWGVPWTGSQKPEWNKTPSVSVCLFPWYKYSYYYSFQADDGLWQPAWKIPEIWVPHCRGPHGREWGHRPQTWEDLAFILIFPSWQLGYPGKATEPEFLHMNWGENDQPRAMVSTRQGGIGHRSQTPVLWGPSWWHGDHSRLAGT